MNEALNELLPRKARLVLYVAASLVSAGIAAWLAANGSWTEFGLAVASLLVNALAARNVPSLPPTDPPADDAALKPQANPEPAEQPPVVDPYDAERRRFLDDYQGGAA